MVWIGHSICLTAIGRHAIAVRETLIADSSTGVITIADSRTIRERRTVGVRHALHTSPIETDRRVTRATETDPTATATRAVARARLAVATAIAAAGGTTACIADAGAIDAGLPGGTGCAGASADALAVEAGIGRYATGDTRPTIGATVRGRGGSLADVACTAAIGATGCIAHTYSVDAACARRTIPGTAAGTLPTHTAFPCRADVSTGAAVVRVAAHIGTGAAAVHLPAGTTQPV